MTTPTQLPPLPALDFSIIGPKPGARFPDVKLEDQHGSWVDLHASRAGRRALVVFTRAVDWCPYCRLQAVDLQTILGALNEESIALFMITTDTVEQLAKFTTNHGIEYPILGDYTRAVIDGLGLKNEHAEAQAAAQGLTLGERGRHVPYPGVFVLDEDGIIADKRFYQNYPERETGSGILEHALGIAAPRHGPEAEVQGEAIKARVSFDSPEYFAGRRLWLTLELDIAEGYHVYGQPIADGYQPLSIEVQTDDGALRAEEPEWPQTQPFKVEGLNETFNVYSGKVRVPMQVLVTRRPVRPAPGEPPPPLQPLDVTIIVTYQACTDSVCLSPVSLKTNIRLEQAERVID